MLVAVPDRNTIKNKKTKMTDEQIMAKDTEKKLLFDADATQRAFELGKWQNISDYAKWRQENVTPFLTEEDPYAYVRNLNWEKIKKAKADKKLKAKEVKQKSRAYSTMLTEPRPEIGRKTLLGS